MLATRTRLIPASPTARMRARAQALHDGGLRVINFAAGELDFDTSDSIKRAAEAAIARGETRYTDTLGLGELRELVAARVSRDATVAYAAEEVAITVGAKQALFQAAMVLLNPGDEVVIPSPYWVTFPVQIELAGAVPVFLDTSKTNFLPDPAELRRLISPRTRAILLNTPHNPTGQVYDWPLLEQIARIAIETDCYLIFDECYAGLVYGTARHNNIVAVVPELKARAVIINSFSKAYCMTGWRIGYLAASREIVKAVGALQGHTTSNTSTVAQHGAIAALRGAAGFVEQTRVLLDARRGLALGRLRAIEDITFPEPRGAFYIFIDLRAYLGASYENKLIESTDVFAELLLEREHVSVVAGTAFGHPNSIRISYAAGNRDIEEGLQRLATFIARLEAA